VQQEEEETETLALEMILTAMGCPLRSPLRILAKQV
jgi:metal-sulfur cluster biosynthetic enzyme